MKRMLHFKKYQANGNDFLILESYYPSEAEAIKLCDRHKGIGADGVLVIEVNNELPRMSIYNSDGSSSTMCGNGSLCAFRFLHQKGVFELRKERQLKIGNHQIQGLVEESCIEICLAKADFTPKNVPFKT